MDVMETFKKVWGIQGVWTTFCQWPLKKFAVADLLKSEFTVNMDTLQPTQEENHARFLIEFPEGRLQMPPQKVKTKWERGSVKHSVCPTSHLGGGWTVSARLAERRPQGYPTPLGGRGRE